MDIIFKFQYVGLGSRSYHFSQAHLETLTKVSVRLCVSVAEDSVPQTGPCCSSSISTALSLPVYLGLTHCPCKTQPSIREAVKHVLMCPSKATQGGSDSVSASSLASCCIILCSLSEFGKLSCFTYKKVSSTKNVPQKYQYISIFQYTWRYHFFVHVARYYYSIL